MKVETDVEGRLTYREGRSREHAVPTMHSEGPLSHRDSREWTWERRQGSADGSLMTHTHTWLVGGAYAAGHTRGHQGGRREENIRYCIL